MKTTLIVVVTFFAVTSAFAADNIGPGKELKLGMVNGANWIILTPVPGVEIGKYGMSANKALKLLSKYEYRDYSIPDTAELKVIVSILQKQKRDLTLLFGGVKNPRILSRNEAPNDFDRNFWSLEDTGKIVKFPASGTYKVIMLRKSLHK